MNRTNYLRKVIQADLESLMTTYSIRAVYYDIVPEDAMYPHIVWDITAVNTGDFFRKDYTVDISIYTKSDNIKLMDVEDAVEDLFCNRNEPTTNILPTFFLVTRQNLEDNDKSIKHGVVRLTAQLYDHN